MSTATARLQPSHANEASRGPGSAGQSSEMITFFLARPAVRSGRQAAHDAGKIQVHVVPVGELLEWARAREQTGAIVDPRIWAGLYLSGKR